MATPKWFDANAYMQNKLAQLKAQEPDAGWTLDKLYDAFREGGFVGAEGQYEHFVKFGAAEEVAPNAYFNADEYYAAKAHEYYGDKFDGSEVQIATVKAMIKDAGMNAWTHYQQFGSAEGVNPSNAFDASAYCAAKAETMNNAGQKAPDGTEWTAEKIADAIADAGMSVLEHYLTYAGTGEGEVASGATYPVADDDQVVVPNLGVKIVVDNDGTSYNGTAGDDSFYVKAENDLQAYHTLDGGEGNDTLTLAAQQGLGGATIRNIENLVVNGGAATPYDLSAFSTSFTLEKATVDVAVDNVTDQKLIVSSTPTAKTLTVSMAADQTSVDLTSQNRDAVQSFALKSDSLTSVKLAVDEDEGENGVDFAGSDNTVTDLAITAADSDDAARADVNVQILTNLANVTVAGAGAVDLVVANSDKLKAVNAAENTGGVTVDLREADNAAFTGGAGADTLTVSGSKVVHTLGAGDDTVVVEETADFASLVKSFSVDGGDGVNTLAMSAQLAEDMTNEVFKVFTNFEVLGLNGSDNNTSTIDLDDFGDINHVAIRGTLGAASTINHMDSNGILEFNDTAGQNITVGVTDADEPGHTTDVLNVKLSANNDIGNIVNTLTVAEVETINIEADDADDNGNAEHSLNLIANDAKTVKVTGDADLVLTGTFAVGATIDISANTADVTFDVKTIGGAVNDETTLTTLKGFTAGDAIKIAGGDENDVLGTKMELGSNWNIEMCLTSAAGQEGDAAWFELGDNTYILFSSNNGIVDAGDVVVKLAGTGYNLEGLNLDGGELTLA